MKFAMNLIAQASALNPSVSILAFEVMNNHFHFVLNALQEDIVQFWECFAKRLGRFYPQVKGIPLLLKSIDNIKSLRNTIAYTHRNGYVANPDYTPFSYRWGSGRYYFLDDPCGVPLSEIRIRERRDLFKCRTSQIPEDWQLINGYISPKSYCDISFGMSMFRDAHHYFSTISKNVEAYNGVATEIDDGEFLTDSELFTQICTIIKSRYGVSIIKDLSKAQRIELAKMLHYDYRSSNGQIRRLLSLTQYEIDSLFPLSAIKK